MISGVVPIGAYVALAQLRTADGRSSSSAASCSREQGGQLALQRLPLVRERVRGRAACSS
jgi:hypothetical protein